MINKIRNFIRYICASVRKDLWVFTSFDGRYSDSPKYISIKLHKINPNIKIFWLVKKESINQLPQYVTGIDIDSKEAYIIKGRARVIIDNVYGGREHTFTVNSSLMFKLKAAVFNFFVGIKKQTVYTTWHGTPFKRMGRDQIGNCCTGFTCPKTVMILGNMFTLNIMRNLTFDKLDLKLLGTPRNDILFNSIDKISLCKSKLGLPADKKILLYAPTFRSGGLNAEEKNVLKSGINQLYELDFDKVFDILHEKFDGEWVFVCRFHYHVDAMIDWEEISEKYNSRIINGNLYDDMAEYLVCTDVLLTDASSCMFDFALTKKPCFIYFPDIENYKNKERGFYIDIDELPFSVSETVDELMINISCFDNDMYCRKITDMVKKFEYADDDKSSERIVNYILGEQNGDFKSNK